MSLVRTSVEYLLGGPKVGGVHEERLRRWASLPPPALAQPHAATRYVVVGTGTAEHAGRVERLVSIGAVGVREGRLDFGDRFAATLRQRRHAGVGEAAGTEPRFAMLDFLEYAGNAPLVGFGPARERQLLERSVKSILGVPLRRPWLDVGALLAALLPDAGCATREAWRARYGIPAVARGDALADAVATAQLMLVVLDAASRAGRVNAAQLEAALRPPAEDADG